MDVPSPFLKKNGVPFITVICNRLHGIPMSGQRASFPRRARVTLSSALSPYRVQSPMYISIAWSICMINDHIIFIFIHNVFMKRRNRGIHGVKGTLKEALYM